ncbi:MAG: prepilin-type N-terminal cleavage/methylation domain-containing protein [Epsilonproteobacteria bacterium]|nr:prepilin-type N-terminal cleavage/methylation domain-containing protein [Campylobacterota bacterium]
MRRGFTLIELVIVVVIVAFLSVAAFKAVSLLVVKSYKSKEITRLSLESQIAIDQLSAWLRYRVPATVIGYDPARSTQQYKPLYELDEEYPVLEWIGYEPLWSDEGNYSGFVDMLASDKSSGLLRTQVQRDAQALIFAGSFDRAYVNTQDYTDAFGWHGGRSLEVFEVQRSGDDLLIVGTNKPKWIYEKYYLLQGAYALARGAQVQKEATCLQGEDIDDDTLLLFYDYRPWKGESFCADPNAQNGAGKVTVLLRNVAGIHIFEQDYTIRIIFDIHKQIKDSVAVHFSKMKVVF